MSRCVRCGCGVVGSDAKTCEVSKTSEVCGVLGYALGLWIALGSAALALAQEAPDWPQFRGPHRDGKCEEVYFLDFRDFENHHGGVVLVGDCVYGGSGNKSGTPVCLDFMTGKIRWKKTSLGKGSAAVLYADGNLIFRYEDGLVALIEASPKQFRVKGTFKAAVIDGPAWPYPVIHDGKLYLRAHNTLMCYDVKAKN